MPRAGRKRRQGVTRYEDGSIVRAERGETEDQIKATAKWQRMSKFGASEDNYTDQLWGFPLGRLRVMAINAADDCEGLSAKQYRAIRRYIMVRHRYLSMNGFPKETPKCVSMEMVSFGLPCWDAEREDEDECEARYNSARAAILEWGQAGVEWQKIIDRLAIDDASVTPDYLGAIRCAANVLAKHWDYVDAKNRLR